MVTSFEYIGRVVLVSNDDWPAVVKNLSQAKKVWSRILGFLSSEGGAPQVFGFFFKVVVHAVLLLGAETWVITPNMGSSMGGVQTRVTRRLTGWLLRRTPDGRWILSWQRRQGRRQDP